MHNSSNFCYFTLKVHENATWFTELDSILTRQLRTGVGLVARFLLILAEFPV